MQMKKYFYFAFQTLFIAITFFALHYTLFDFSSSENPQQLRESWASVLYFDAFVGISTGLLISVFTVPVNTKGNGLLAAIILTDIVWLVFCLWWYMGNRGAINVEAVGHAISPIIVGAFGSFLAVCNLIYAILQSRKRA